AHVQLAEMAPNDRDKRKILEEAIPSFNDAISLDPDNPEHHFGMGHTYYLLLSGRDDPDIRRRSRQSLEKAIELDDDKKPTQAEARYYLASLINKDPKRAPGYLTQMLDLLQQAINIGLEEPELEAKAKGGVEQINMKLNPPPTPSTKIEFPKPDKPPG
ncbi:MAG: tetratricopeptide repeat protein, partial [Candidatus Altiarchaeota archaeon]